MGDLIKDEESLEPEERKLNIQLLTKIYYDS